MDSKLSPYMNEQEDSDVGGQENLAGSPPSSTIYHMDGMVTSSSTSSSSSSLKRRRGIQKRVVQIPIKETEGSISNTPPSDSWAWRKYGQKPIKGSLYPRGYYRCSSNKECPARKQVERSRVDPTMLVVTFSSDHNHSSSSAVAKPAIINKPEPELPIDPEENFADELGWLGEMNAIATTSSVVLQSPIFAGYDADVASVFMPMGEEDESLFTDLGELPECSLVFRRGSLETAEEWRRWCGTTS